MPENKTAMSPLAEWFGILIVVFVGLCLIPRPDASSYQSPKLTPKEEIVGNYAKSLQNDEQAILKISNETGVPIDQVRKARDCYGR